MVNLPAPLPIADPRFLVIPSTYRVTLYQRRASRHSGKRACFTPWTAS